VGGVQQVERVVIDGRCGATTRRQSTGRTPTLYTLLEQQIVPTFYDRDAAGVPRAWLRIVKEAIRTVMPQFTTRRMVKQYVREMYAPAMGLEPK
jgi:starch phosphorylase